MIDDIIVDYYIRMKARRKENRFRRGNFICNCYYIYVQVVVEINFRILSCKVAESILLLSSFHLHFVVDRDRSINDSNR